MPSPTRWRRVGICWCRPAPAPGSRWATSRRRWSRWRTADRPDRGRHGDARPAEPAGQQRHPGRPGRRRGGHRRVGRHAILKGRTNYACLLKVRDSAAEDQAALISASDLAGRSESAPATPESALGAEVLALREWAEDRRSRRVWPTATTRLRTPIGPGSRCPSRCGSAWASTLPARRRLFRGKVPGRARAADLVVTNHALLAINAMHGGTALPEHERGHHRRGPRTGRPGDRRGLGGAESRSRSNGSAPGADLSRGRPGARAAGVGRSPCGPLWTERPWSGSRIPTRRSSRRAAVRTVPGACVSAMTGGRRRSTRTAAGRRRREGDLRHRRADGWR